MATGNYARERVAVVNFVNQYLTASNSNKRIGGELRNIQEKTKTSEKNI
jgi:hypothetical protein